MNVLNDFEVAMLAAEIGIFEWPLAAAVVAGSQPIGETAIGILGPGPQQVAIGAILIHPSAAVTASDTNYFTITVNKRTAGGAAVPIANASSSLTAGSGPTGNWSAWTTVAMTVVAGAFISPQDVVTVVTTKTGTPQTIPQLYLGGFTTIK